MPNDQNKVTLHRVTDLRDKRCCMCGAKITNNGEESVTASGMTYSNPPKGFRVCIDTDAD